MVAYAAQAQPASQRRAAQRPCHRYLQARKKRTQLHTKNPSQH